jgi:Na+/proline symporter/signal transduction histidine kinase/CheY-like chemotaxis protein
MAIQGWTVLIVGLAYVGLLFAVATWGDAKSTAQAKHRRPKPLIYALSLAVYCTSWTYFGSVGAASRTGFDFIPVYLGPILMFALGAPLIARVVLLAKRQNIASIADFIAARYGKNEGLGALVAIIATIGIVPYISIQLKALSFSLQAMMDASGWAHSTWLPQTLGGDLAFFITIALAAFAMLFGTRHIDATEHQDGLMLAIAVESLVKLAAFLTVGLFVVFGLAGGPAALIQIAQESPDIAKVFSQAPDGARWLTVTLLSACAIMLLPRQFHVAVVENAHGSDVRRAAWLFPLYLIAINIFVAPIAIMGLAQLPGVDADTYVLALPVAAQAHWIAFIAFIGGVSAATAMVIVETIALAIMISNNVIVPLVLLRQGEHNMFQHSPAGDKSPALLTIRRVIICLILMMAYVYFWSAGNSAALAQTGLISFAAVAQFAPAFFGGLIWTKATARGAVAGILAGFAVWAYTLLIPSFVDSGWISSEILTEGLFGIAALKPRQLMGLEFEPLTHGVIWSLTCNIAAYIGFSLMRAPTRIEELQASIFTAQDLQGTANPGFRLWRSNITTGRLEETVARYLGRERARQAFADLAASRDLDDDPKLEADIVSLNHGEHLVASAVGPASARLVMALLLEKHAKGSRKAMQLLDEASTAIQASRKLLQSAIDNMPQGIAVFSERSDLIIWNPHFEEVLRLPPTLCQVATPLTDIIAFVTARTDAKLDATELQQRVNTLTTSRKIFRERFTDSRVVVDMQTAALPDGGIVLTITDVTQSVAAADALQLANETLELRVQERTAELTKLNAELARAKARADTANLSKTRFIAAASHDILQPLNAARLFTSSLVESTDGHKNDQLIRNVDQSLEAVEDILATVLDISRFDAGAVKPELSLFHVQDILTPLAQEFAPLAKQKNLDLRILPSRAIVHSDRKLLRRVLQNLISNAIKYTPKGRVLVGCRKSDASLHIKIYDTGLGIPEAQNKTVFLEFERLGRDKNETPGLGLGLSIVERMCAVLRHPLSFSSQVDKGTVFSVAVPLGQGNVLALHPAEQNIKHNSVLRGLRVLAVDNEVAIVEGLRALLSGWGVDVVTATSSAEALQVVKASPIFDAILADYHINDEDGIELVAALRNELGQHVPAVLITADRSVRVRDLAVSQGMIYMRKPVKPAALRAALSQVTLRKAAE